MGKIIFIVSEANKPSAGAIKRLNKKAYEMVLKDIKKENA